MRSLLVRGIVGVTLLLAPIAARAEFPPVLGAADRAAAAARPVAVLPPLGLATSVDIGRVAPANSSGGLIGMIMIDAMDDRRDVMTGNAQAKAEVEAAPLIKALDGQDTAALAVETTRRIAATGTLFNPDAAHIVPSAGFTTAEALVAAHPSPQYGVVSYQVRLSPDFTQLRVIGTVAVHRSSDRTQLSKLHVISIVELRSRSYVHRENVERWLGRDGGVARDALTAAFQRLQTVIPAAIALDTASFAAKTDKRKIGPVFAAGFYGPEFLRDDRGVVLWSRGNGLIAVQPASD